ncbi:Fe-S cluster assembly ATPase SufC [Flagellatimonas centrodinii]|uniref:Fe-S cluster assembly ATPase SufC n=1 Tax=Flagellatimonas centrodinii TaxID=2806210 RepID=UPI0026464886|nr:Fe-S cluster assembly ATPase SufC [Flagellatimonas centrodinii]
MLEINNLHVSIDDKPILKGIDLTLKAGEVHAIMGPNGSGKSTLSNVLAGRDDYTVTDGSVRFLGQDLLDMSPEQRACAGVFLGFQYPVEIPGVSNLTLLKAALNAKRKHEGKPEIEATDFLAWVRDRVQKMDMTTSMLQRGVNEGFSGGEKKRNEILQMLILEPTLMILDETDSGLDIDALKIVSDGINLRRSAETATLLVTHYQRLLDHVKPDVVHVLSGGRIIKTGGPELAHELEARGYGWLEQAA